MVHVLMISTPFNTFLDFAANQKFKVFHDSFSLKKGLFSVPYSAFAYFKLFVSKVDEYLYL